MYVGMLSDALHAQTRQWSGEGLIDRVVDSRVQLLSARLGGRSSAYDLLSAEIAYDVSLILLCDDLGVRARPVDFADPMSARTRLERELLSSWGLDVCALSRARVRT